jgi:hypothetical protein
MQEWVLSIHHEHGMHTLDEVGMLVPPGNWAQLFLAIDSLSRDGPIELRWFRHGEYLLTMRDPS